MADDKSYNPDLLPAHAMPVMDETDAAIQGKIRDLSHDSALGDIDYEPVPRVDDGPGHPQTDLPRHNIPGRATAPPAQSSAYSPPSWEPSNYGSAYSSIGPTSQSYSQTMNILPTPPPQGVYSSHDTRQDFRTRGMLPTPSQSPAYSTTYQPQQKLPMRGQLPTPSASPAYSVLSRDPRYGPQHPSTPASMVGSPAPVSAAASPAPESGSDPAMLMRLFRAVDKGSKGYLTLENLQSALVNGDWTPFHPATVDVCMRMFDESRSGRLDYKGFSGLWGFLFAWKNLFERFDVDRDGHISFEEFKKALVAFGYKVGDNFSSQVFRRFDVNGKGLMSFDNFVHACVVLKKVTDKFKKWDSDRDGYATLSFEDYMLDILGWIRLNTTGQNQTQAMAETPPAAPSGQTVPLRPSSIKSQQAPPTLPPVLEETLSSETIPGSEFKDSSTGASPIQKSLNTSLSLDHILANWKNIVPTDLDDVLQVRELPGSGTVWTCTPWNGKPFPKIPLRIAGYPVVVPVQHEYPAHTYTLPPPDPHPILIDTSKEIDEDTVNLIFETYEDVFGFYLLINGMLQLIVPEDFDYVYALSHRPLTFGGLKVSYIAQDIVPTADVSVEDQAATTATTTVDQLQASSSTSTTPVAGRRPAPGQSPSPVRSRAQPTNPMNLRLGSTFQAHVDKSKAPERFQGKIGLMTIADDQYYLVVSSHVLTSALTAAKSDKFPGSSWKNHVKVLAGNGGREIGKVTETFDPNARTFPHGFLHDISLVDVTSAPMHLVRGISAPLPTEWLSQAGWNSIKYSSQSLFLLDSPDIEAKSIGIMGSQCQMVGQGIFKLKERSEKKTRFKFSFGHRKSESTDVETWTSLVSRSVLYRVNPDFRAPGAASGTAVCIHEESEDQISCAKVAGFSSWAQPATSDVTRFDVDEKKFYSRLEEGRVAFYGAFQAPVDLREGHSIA